MDIIDFRERPKVCHFRPGMCVRLFNEHGGEEGLYLICSVGKLNTTLGSSGLYKADVPIFMVDMRTGIARDLPHLSSRLLEEAKDAKITIQ